jgi:hypothetical protein
MQVPGGETWRKRPRPIKQGQLQASSEQLITCVMTEEARLFVDCQRGAPIVHRHTVEARISYQHLWLKDNPVIPLTNDDTIHEIEHEVCFRGFPLALVCGTCLVTLRLRNAESNLEDDQKYGKRDADPKSDRPLGCRKYVHVVALRDPGCASSREHTDHK